MRITTRSALPLFLAVLCSAGLGGAPGPQSAGSGLTAAQFRSLAGSLPKLPGRIQAVLLFREAPEGTGAALATLENRGGWHILVFGSRRGHGFKLVWDSGRLGDGFAVSSPSSLRVFSLGGEDAVQFSGCGRHVCPDVFSFMLYIPSLRTSFTATSAYRKVTYSSNMRLPSDEKYKSALDQLIDEHARFIQELAPRGP